MFVCVSSIVLIDMPILIGNLVHNRCTLTTFLRDKWLKSCLELPFNFFALCISKANSEHLVILDNSRDDTCSYSNDTR